MSFTVEYRVAATALNIRAISMSLRTLWENIAGVSESAPLLELAVAEGMNNVLDHAYNGANAGDMRIVVQMNDLQVAVSIFDRGEEPNQERISSVPSISELGADSSIADELSCEGRGRFIMASLMDTVEYERSGDENRLKMTKSICHAPSISVSE